MSSPMSAESEVQTQATNVTALVEQAAKDAKASPELKAAMVAPVPNSRGAAERSLADFKSIEKSATTYPAFFEPFASTRSEFVGLRATRHYEFPRFTDSRSFITALVAFYDRMFTMNFNLLNPSTVVDDVAPRYRRVSGLGIQPEALYGVVRDDMRSYNAMINAFFPANAAPVLRSVDLMSGTRKIGYDTMVLDHIGLCRSLWLWAAYRQRFERIRPALVQDFLQSFPQRDWVVGPLPEFPYPELTYSRMTRAAREYDWLVKLTQVGCLAAVDDLGGIVSRVLQIPEVKGATTISTLTNLLELRANTAGPANGFVQKISPANGARYIRNVLHAFTTSSIAHMSFEDLPVEHSLVTQFSCWGARLTTPRYLLDPRFYNQIQNYVYTWELYPWVTSLLGEPIATMSPFSWNQPSPISTLLAQLWTMAASPAGANMRRALGFRGNTPADLLRATAATQLHIATLGAWYLTWCDDGRYDPRMDPLMATSAISSQNQPPVMDPAFIAAMDAINSMQTGAGLAGGVVYAPAQMVQTAIVPNAAMRPVFRESHIYYTQNGGQLGVMPVICSVLNDSSVPSLICVRMSRFWNTLKALKFSKVLNGVASHRTSEAIIALMRNIAEGQIVAITKLQQSMNRAAATLALIPQCQRLSPGDTVGSTTIPIEGSITDLISIYGLDGSINITGDFSAIIFDGLNSISGFGEPYLRYLIVDGIKRDPRFTDYRISYKNSDWWQYILSGSTSVMAKRVSEAIVQAGPRIAWGPPAMLTAREAALGRIYDDWVASFCSNRMMVVCGLSLNAYMNVPKSIWFGPVLPIGLSISTAVPALANGIVTVSASQFFRDIATNNWTGYTTGPVRIQGIPTLFTLSEEWPSGRDDGLEVKDSLSSHVITKASNHYRFVDDYRVNDAAYRSLGPLVSSDWTLALTNDFDSLTRFARGSMASFKQLTDFHSYAIQPRQDVFFG